MIHFAAPGYFALLLVVIAMAGAAVWHARWRARARETFAGVQTASWPATSFWPRLLLVLLAAVLIVVAAARPQWGTKHEVRQRSGVDLVIALDVSQSMQATDVAPSRIGLATEELARLVETQRGNRTGLVLFAGSAILRSPLTTDAFAMGQLLRRAEREAALTRPGSDLGSAFDQAGLILKVSENAGKAVILVSDGEDHPRNFTEKLRALKDNGVVVYTAGVGTPEGTGLNDVDPRTGQPRPKVDSQGRPVVTHLDEATLQAIASAGGGRYLRISGNGSLLSLREDLANLKQTPIGDESQTLHIERFQAFVAASLVLLAEAWLLPARMLNAGSLRWPRRLRLRPSLALVLVALFAGACGSSDGGLRDANSKANQAYAGGDFEGALKVYEDLLSRRPDVPELSLNAGNALHRLERFDRAVAETQRALPPTDPKLGAVTYYELGDHLLALDRLEPAYDAFKSALLLNPDDADAKYNLELTLLRLRKQQEEQQRRQPGAGQQPQQPGATPPGETPAAPPSGQGQPGDPQQPSSNPGQSAAEAQRALQEALRGIDQNLTFEEAVRILDLLRQQQERQRPGFTPGTSPGPDY